MKGARTPPNLPKVEQLVSAVPRSDVGYTSAVDMYRKFQLADTPSFPRIAIEIISHSFSRGGKHKFQTFPVVGIKKMVNTFWHGKNSNEDAARQEETAD